MNYSRNNKICNILTAICVVVLVTLMLPRKDFAKETITPEVKADTITYQALNAQPTTATVQVMDVPSVTAGVTEAISQMIAEPETEPIEPEFIYIEIVDMPEDMQKQVFEICQEYDIAFTLVMALIEHESDCRVDVVSKTNDYGLMQINKCNHEWMCGKLDRELDFLTVKDNVESGCYILRYLFKKYEDVHQVLMCYNMGENGAKKCWNDGKWSSKYSRAIVDREIELSAWIDERNY